MSFFGKMFGGGGKQKSAWDTNEAIQNLRKMEEMLIKKQEFLEQKIDNELEVAKKNGSKNKRAAIQALKRKKRFEKQLKQIDGTLSMIEMQREALEGAKTNAATITSMKQASDAMKTVQKDLNIDKIQDIMDDVAEQLQVSNEMTDLLSSPIGGVEDFDESELMKELEDLEQEELNNELLGIHVNEDKLPDVPTSDLKQPIAANANRKSKGIEDDEDMKNLLPWAN